MIRLASFLAPGDLRPRLGAAEGEMMRDLTAAHGADWNMRRVLALPIAELRAFVAAGNIMLPAARCHLLPRSRTRAKFFVWARTAKSTALNWSRRAC